MFVKVNGMRRTSTYYGSDGSQHAARGAYLMLAAPEHFAHWDAEAQTYAKPETYPETDHVVLYAAIRSVAMRQFGHFMMGSARVANGSVSVSGSFGSDSLPLSYDKLTEAQRALFVRLPLELAARYWKDENAEWSHGNSAPIRSVGDAIRDYVIANDPRNLKKSRSAPIQ